MAEVADGVELRIGAGEDRGMRDRGQRRLREGLLEDHALLGDDVQVGRQAAGGAKETHAVCARGVDCDQD